MCAGTGCREPIKLRAARLLLRDAPAAADDAVRWNWARGAATSLGEFGAPLTTTSYAVCVYDGVSSLLGLEVPAGGTCDGEPCWKERGDKRGFRYRDRDGTPSGVEEVRLKPSGPGRTRIDVASPFTPYRHAIAAAVAFSFNFASLSVNFVWHFARSNGFDCSAFPFSVAWHFRRLRCSRTC